MLARRSLPQTDVGGELKFWNLTGIIRPAFGETHDPLGGRGEISRRLRPADIIFFLAF